jgi:triosephosphate isomerase
MSLSTPYYPAIPQWIAPPSWKPRYLNIQGHAIDQNDRNGVAESITNIVNNLNSAKLDSTTEVVISPPALYLTLTRSLADPKIGVAAQNVFDKPNGAFTGEISVEQLKDTKIDWVVIGHSERRVILKETDEVCTTRELRVLNNAPVLQHPTATTDTRY